MRKQLLTTGEVAAALGLHSRTIARYARDGLITPELITAGGHYRWDLEKVKAELRKLAEDQRRQRDE